VNLDAPVHFTVDEVDMIAGDHAKIIAYPTDELSQEIDLKLDEFGKEEEEYYDIFEREFVNNMDEKLMQRIEDHLKNPYIPRYSNHFDAKDE
jgi:hypothetical protein